MSYRLAQRFKQVIASQTTLWRGLSLGVVPYDEFDSIKANPGAELQRAMGGYQNVGIHWTDDAQSAENFALGRGPDGWAEAGWDEEEGMDVGFILEAEVSEADILDPDSEEGQNYAFSDAILDYGIERERTLRADSPVQVTKAYMVWADGYGNDPGGMVTIPMSIRTTAMVPQPGAWYHLSNRPLPLGTVLVPHGPGGTIQNFKNLYEKDEWRKGKVYITKNPSYWEGMIPSAYVYRVEPLSRVDPVPDTMQITWDDDDGDPEYMIMEYMVDSARIVEIVEQQTINEEGDFALVARMRPTKE